MKSKKVNKVCRVCLIENAEINIFTNNIIDNFLIYKVIVMITSLKISVKDGLPDQICSNCFTDLKTAAEFRKKCLESDKNLHLMNTNASLKQDSEIKNEDYANKNAIDNIYASNLVENYQEKTILYPESIVKIEPDNEWVSFNCELCAKSFSSVCELKKHSKKHKEKKSFQCRVCSKIFRQNSHLQRHLLIHTNVKPYSCDVCNKSFKQKPHLIRHVSLHTGLKPFQCEVCGKKFVTPSDLNKHSIIHTGNRPFQCEICGKSYNNTSDLNKHSARKHDKNFSRFMCKICKVRYGTKKALNQHLLVHCDSGSIWTKLKCD